MKENNNPKNELLKNVARLSGIGIQIALIIFLSAYFGKWVDAQFVFEKKWFTLVATLLGVAISLYTVQKQLKNLNKDKNDK